MRVLVGCEKSGIVRDEFIKLGHDAISLDLEPSRRPGPHIQQCIVAHLKSVPDKFYDLIIVHPECTTLTISGNSTYGQYSDRYQERLDQLDWVQDLWILCCEKGERVCLENPVGVLATMSMLPKPQYVQPFHFGEDASKKTGLYLYNLAPLVNTIYFPGRNALWGGKVVTRWSNQTDEGSNTLGRVKNRKELRSNTYPGIARAMAYQWGEKRVIKYFNQKCKTPNCFSEHFYADWDRSTNAQISYKKCCMCNQVEPMYAYHHEIESAVICLTFEEFHICLDRGCEPIEEWQYALIEIGLVEEAFTK